jgi:hypothetical protein
MDGPLGAAVLARALQGVGHHSVFVVAEPLTPVLEELARVAGVRDFDVVAVDSDEASPELGLWLDRCRAGIAIEALGENDVGVRHFVSGLKYESDSARAAETLFRELRARRRLTIGIGDGGNEIGFGRIRQDVAELVPWGKVCRCDCGHGIAAVTETDFLLPASISNWGAYAVANAIAVVRGDHSLLHQRERELELLRTAGSLGCRDGVTLTCEARQDGVDTEGCLAMVDLLEQIAREWVLEYRRPF